MSALFMLLSSIVDLRSLTQLLKKSEALDDVHPFNFWILGSHSSDAKAVKV